MWEVAYRRVPRESPLSVLCPQYSPFASIASASPGGLWAAGSSSEGQQQKQPGWECRVATILEKVVMPLPPPFQPLLGKGSSSLMKLIDNVHFFLEAFENCQGW